MVVSPYAQHGYRLRFAWGLDGARDIAESAGLAVVVDVLSFTTTLTVALDRGVVVLPYRWCDASARAFAAERDAALAMPRPEAGPGDVSLSPGSVRSAVGLRRLVLPSPNGSAIVHAMGDIAGDVVGVCLRNLTATAAWLSERLRSDPLSSVAVVASGELRAGGGLRPAVEDMWGAGGLLARLSGYGMGPASPESESAIAAYGAVVSDLAQRMRVSASGQELIGAGYGQDVEVAAEVDVSRVVPLLGAGGFRDAAG